MERLRIQPTTETPEQVASRLNRQKIQIENSDEYRLGRVLEPESGFREAVSKLANIDKRLRGLIPTAFNRSIDIYVFGVEGKIPLPSKKKHLKSSGDGLKAQKPY